MDESIIPNQPEPVIEPKKPFVLPAPTLVLAGAAVFILLLTLLAVWYIFKPKEEAGPAPLPIPTPSHANASRPISPFATSSAFTSVESSVASLSAVVSAYSVEDSTVAPPTLELPLGFTQ